MTVDDLGAYLKTHWPTIRAAWRAGTDGPQPVRRTAIPKAGGGTRHVGLPPGLDRCSEHALWQVVPEAWDPTGAARSDGVRPPHSADHAVGPAPAEIRAGDAGVGDMALARCCDQGNHDG
jgi:RNA-directed DNA polymerase